MATSKKRSRPAPAVPGKLTRLVHTHVTEQVGLMLAEKISRLRIKEAAYVRQLIERDLGVLTSEEAP